jgi:magnesium transporter
MSEINKIKKRIRKIGLQPGELIQTDESDSSLKITVIDYDKDTFIEKDIKEIEECFVYRNKPTITWINLDGTQQKEIIEKIGNCFNIHPLILEDIMTSGQRPKLEDYQDYLFIVIKMIYPNKNNEEITDEQLSLLIGSNYVISFQEKPGDPFNIIRERLRKNLGKTRKMGTDYLAYSLMDIIIDNYYIVLEKIAEKMEELEDETLDNPSNKTLQKIHDIKRELIYFRKFVWPLREVINLLNRTETKLIKKPIQPYIKDLYDHVIQLIDSIETYRDIIASILEIYLSSISNGINKVMKRLTLINCVFMPLTFFAGIGGMSEWSMMTGSGNWKIAYPAFILCMGIIGFITYKIFKWNGWT